MKKKGFTLIIFLIFSSLFAVEIESDIQKHIEQFNIIDWTYNIYRTSEGFYHVVLNINFDPFIDTDEIKYINNEIKSNLQQKNVKYLINIYRKYRVKILETDPEEIELTMNDLKQKLQGIFNEDEYELYHELNKEFTNIYIHVNPYIDFNFDQDMNK